MISPDEFLTYLCKIEGGAVSVDLLKIGQATGSSSSLAGSAAGKSANASNSSNTANVGAGKFPAVKLRLALDMEDCLDRFYGGYYSGMLFTCYAQDIFTQLR